MFDPAGDRRHGRFPGRPRRRGRRPRVRHRHRAHRAAAQPAGRAGHGIDLSPDMVAQLRAKPGAEAIGVTIGDMTSTRVDGDVPPRLPRLQHDRERDHPGRQVACFCNAAAHLEPGGCFVIEVGIPQLRRLPPGDTVQAFTVSPTELGFDSSTSPTSSACRTTTGSRRAGRDLLDAVALRLARRARPHGAHRRDATARALGGWRPSRSRARAPARLGVGEDCPGGRSVSGFVRPGVSPPRNTERSPAFLSSD